MCVVGQHSTLHSRTVCQQISQHSALRAIADVALCKDSGQGIRLTRWNLPLGHSGLRKLEPPVSPVSSLQPMAELPEGQCWVRKIPEPIVTLPSNDMLLPYSSVH